MINRFFSVATICALGMASALADGTAAPILSQPDPDSPFGERNGNAPDGLDQFEFVIRSAISYDDGETCDDGSFSLTATRK